MRRILNQSSSISALPGDVSVAQLVASMSGVVLGGVGMVVGSNLARGKLFTASIGSVDSLDLKIYRIVDLITHAHAHTHTHTHKVKQPALSSFNAGFRYFISLQSLELLSDTLAKYSSYMYYNVRAAVWCLFHPA